MDTILGFDSSTVDPELLEELFQCLYFNVLKYIWFRRGKETQNAYLKGWMKRKKNKK